MKKASRSSPTSLDPASRSTARSRSAGEEDTVAAAARSLTTMCSATLERPGNGANRPGCRSGREGEGRGAGVVGVVVVHQGSTGSGQPPPSTSDRGPRER